VDDPLSSEVAIDFKDFENPQPANRFRYTLRRDAKKKEKKQRNVQRIVMP